MYKPNIDLSKFEAMYTQFDGGHGIGHITRVRNLAVRLAEKYISDKVKLAYVAATLHDIGLINGRDKHEIIGATLILEDKDLPKFLTEEEIKEIAYAVREHRASNGKPETILAKIISDADKVSDSPSEAMRRAMEYGKVNMPKLNEQQQIWRAAIHLKEKFGGTGTGNRLYFSESKQALIEAYKPIFEAVEKNDYVSLVKIIERKNKYTQ